MASHRKEKGIVYSAIIMTMVLLIKFVPRQKIREAQVSFLFQQAITWFFGLLVVEKKLIKYPYRRYFKRAVKSSFLFEYFICPAISALHNLYYPEKKSVLRRLLYTCSYSGLITFLEFFIEKYTDLITYRKWSWYWSFLSLSSVFYLSWLYSRWYFKKEE